MGGRRPTSPKIIPGKPPREERPGTTFKDMSPEERRRLMDMCPDPNMHILMADGSQKKAGDLVVGDLVKTYHEESFKLGNYKVEYVDVINNSKKIKLIFDESEIICSTSHKFYVDESWKSAEDMVIGDEVSSKKLISVENIEDGDVIHITIEDAHTYICEGLLSHNKGRRRRSFAEDARSGNLPNIDFTPRLPRTGPDIMPKKDRPLPLPPGFVCPDPDMNILMADGLQKKAGDLLVGDLVKTYHEESFELGNYEVEHVDIINDVEKIKLTFDKSTIICSLSHKFYVGDSWKEAKDMIIGDVVSDNKLVAIESVEDGDVVHITVKDAHTYICEGLLSHNKSPRPPRDPRRPVGRRRRPSRPVGRRMPPRPRPRPRPRPDDLGPPPEREVPIPEERIRPITRESDPRGGAPFAPDERGMARDRFFERMFDRAEEEKQRRSMQKEERREIRQARNEERRARRSEPGEIDIDRERGRRRRRRRDFTRRRSRMERGRSMEERAAFRDRYVSTLGGGFFS